MSILSQKKKIRFRFFFRFFAIISRRSFRYFFFATFCVKTLDLSKSTKATKMMNSKKNPEFFSGFCHGCTPFMNACIYSIYGCKYCYYTFRVMARPFSKKCVFYQFTKTRNLWSYSKIACFINLLKDCVGQAFFAKVLGGITQFWNCLFYQLSNTQFRRIEKTTTNCVFYQFT